MEADAIEPFGESATLVGVGVATSTSALALAARVRAALPGADVVVGGASVLVDGAAPAEVRAALEASRGAAAWQPPEAAATSRSHTIAVRYDGEDLEAVAAAAGLAVSEVIRRHAARAYVVQIVGFLPGFAYLGDLDGALVLPRRSAPRKVVPARSVAIAGPYTGVYPFASSGGWHLIGSAIDFVPFDAERGEIALAAGDSVRFEESAHAPATTKARAPAAEARAPARGLEIVRAPAAATIQDGGRRGQLSRGLPPSGPLDEDALRAANMAVGNPPLTAALEVPLGALEVRARGRVGVAVDGAAARPLEDGDRLRVEPEGRAVRYLAVAGGVFVPEKLGSRATLLIANLGGLGGRALRRGDVVPIGMLETAAASGEARDAGRYAARAHPPSGDSRDDQGAALAVLPGPHLARFPAGALQRFLDTTFSISRLGDRVGVRLEGAAVQRSDRDAGSPTPMVRGAVQITTDGTPIVLGPDHPTTGGYPVIAVLTRAAQGAFARRLPGATVKFVLAHGQGVTRWSS